MVRLINKSLATALLCGAIGLAGSALAQDNSGQNAGSNTSAGANATESTHTGPGQIDSSAPAKANNSSYGASDKTAAGASDKTAANEPSQTDKPDFLSSVQSKSTPARGLKGAAMKRVDTNERRITAELNRASASSTGNANASSQASIRTGSDQNIQ